MQIPINNSRKIVLFDGTTGNALSVAPKDSTIISENFAETQSGPNRILTVSGTLPGTTQILVKQGRKIWLTLDVEVTASGKQEGDFVRAARKGMTP
jgi:hypothetical protein